VSIKLGLLGEAPHRPCGIERWEREVGRHSPAGRAWRTVGELVTIHVFIHLAGRDAHRSGGARGGHRSQRGRGRKGDAIQRRVVRIILDKLLVQYIADERIVWVEAGPKPVDFRPKFLVLLFELHVGVQELVG